MLLLFFEPYYFLQAVGWGIGNSLWQTALLWMLYKLATSGKRPSSAELKYQLSLAGLFCSLGWFIITILTQYQQLINGEVFYQPALFLAPTSLSGVLQLISAIYLIVTPALCIRFLFQVRHLKELSYAGLEKAPVNIRLFATKTALSLGISKEITIWLSQQIQVPSVIGFFKPVILLPIATINQLSVSQIESIILHELAHIKRNDYLVNLFQSLAEMLLFFNPFAKMLGDFARKERENCCDDWVLNYQYKPHEYAEALVVLEQNRLRQLPLALAATNGKKHLLERVKRLFMDPPPCNSDRFPRMKLVAFAFLVILGASFFMPAMQKTTLINKVEEAVSKTAVPFAVAVHFKSQPGNNEAEASPAEKSMETAVTESRVALKNAKDKKPHPVKLKPGATTYQVTLVNEALFQQQDEARPIPIAGHNELSDKQLIVQVEEEQSGVAGKTSYTMMITQNNGQSSITPLIIKRSKPKPIAKIKDSLCSNHSEAPISSCEPTQYDLPGQ